jgi:hypothetical protein
VLLLLLPRLLQAQPKTQMSSQKCTPFSLPFRSSSYCCSGSTEMAMAEQKRCNAAKQNAPLSATKTRTQKEQDLFVWTSKAEDEDKPKR